MQYREAFYLDARGVFAARNRLNGHFVRISPEYGGHYRILGWCHTFYRLLPPSEYFDDHPEWYSEIDGKRVTKYAGLEAQLCLTNNEMRQELTRRALEWIRKDPAAGIISISQNDTFHGNCQCANCLAIEEREGSPSGPLIEFINQVASDIEKEFPDILIETLAYRYTRQAPRSVRPRHNVIIRLSSIECSFSQTLETGPQNEAFRRDIEQWSAISPQLFVWDYVTNFKSYILPHPNQRVIAPNIRFFVRNKAVGLFAQGDAESTAGDFVELRAWVLARLMWDPSRDEEALVTEFLNGYYGAAAQSLQEYLDLTHDAVERAGTHLSMSMPDTSAWLPTKDMVRATELFAAAAQAVKDDPVLSRRVRRARMPLDHAWLQQYHSVKRTARLTGKTFAIPDGATLLEDFIKSAHAFNVRSYREGGPFKNLEMRLREKFLPGAAAVPPAEVAGLGENYWIDVQNDGFLLYGLGRLVHQVDDVTASDKRATRMLGNHNQWLIQYWLPDGLAELGPWRCYAVVRCQVKDGIATLQGEAFQLGLWDSNAPGEVARLVVTLADAADGAYRTYELGVHDLRAGMYFWVAPVNNPEVDSVYVDRFFFVREKAVPKR